MSIKSCTSPTVCAEAGSVCFFPLLPPSLARSQENPPFPAECIFRRRTMSTSSSEPYRKCAPPPPRLACLGNTDTGDDWDGWRRTSTSTAWRLRFDTSQIQIAKKGPTLSSQRSAARPDFLPRSLACHHHHPTPPPPPTLRPPSPSLHRTPPPPPFSHDTAPLSDETKGSGVGQRPDAA
ncbi:hypothetical protein EDC01DRAFT_372894 [Geopyxis carbonaria]|nr:hypothetical protein EDC01DRAFT_372894 [Geopyxis carbonaria]